MHTAERLVCGAGGRRDGTRLVRSAYGSLVILPRAQDIPAGFRWGVASAGHQTEGGNTQSDTWFLEHVRPTVFREPSGQACDSYARWREDVDLVAALGLDTYRFSVEWARVEPAEGEFSAPDLAHYRAIVDHCLASGITPMVTYNHFTSPHWFARRGGWLDPQAPAVSRATATSSPSRSQTASAGP